MSTDNLRGKTEACSSMFAVTFTKIKTVGDVKVNVIVNDQLLADL